MKEDIKSMYNKLAKAYYESRKNMTGTSYFYNELLEMPAMIRMLGDLKDKKVLDIGCGPGIYIEKIKDRCKQVKGIDISEGEVKIARTNNPGIEIVVGNAENLPFRNCEFDVVFASLVLGHLDSWDRTLGEIRRVLKKNGIFCFSIHNPVTGALVSRKWFFRKFDVVKNYFEEKGNKRIWSEEIVGVKAESFHHHKTYETVIKSLIKNSFEIIDYEDCRPDFEAKKLFPEKYEETMNIPKFCVWKVR